MNQRTNPNSALNWLPPIETAGLPVPHTVVFLYKHSDCLGIFDGVQNSEFDRLSAAVDLYLEKTKRPLFVRTDLGSAKHDGPRAYRLEPGIKSAPTLCRLLEDQEIKFWLAPNGPTAILLRDFLLLRAEFLAFGGLPVNREFRFFADQAGVQCFHPYWPHDALVGHVDEGRFPNWRESLSSLHEISYEEHRALASMALKATQAIGDGAWSVDFAQDTDGKWFLIDMACANESFHWPECEAA